MLQRTRLQRRSAASSATTLAVIGALLASVLVSTPAVAAPGDGITPPTTAPDRVYRVDQRSPEEILAAGGFHPAGDSSNLNLFDHINATSIGEQTTGFVSTSARSDFATEWLHGGGARAGWVYEIAPASNFHSVGASFHRALEDHPEWAEIWEADWGAYLESILAQQEWAAVGSIPVASIDHAYQLRLTGDNDLDFEVEEAWANPAFQEPADGATVDPFPIEEVSQCLDDLAVAGSCVRPPRGEDLDEGALEDLHRESFSGDIDDVRFSLDKDVAAREAEALLAPLPESIGVSEDLVAAGHSPGSFSEYAKDISAGFRADAEALAAVTADAGVIGAASRALGSAVDVGSELLPYIGIAATGYALREDLDNGRWGDAAADAIAESLQVAMVAAPEFDVFLEPALIVVAVTQMIGDTVWGWTHPKPRVSEAQEHAILQANDAYDASIGVAADLREQEKRAIAEQVLLGHIDDSIAPAANVRFASDKEVIRAGAAAVRFDIFRHAEIAQQKISDPAGQARIRADRDQAIAAVQAAARDAMQKRFDQYVGNAENVVETAVNATWNSDAFVPVDRQFFREVARPYFATLAEHAYRAFLGNLPEFLWQLLGAKATEFERGRLTEQAVNSLDMENRARDQVAHPLEAAVMATLKGAYLNDLVPPGNAVIGYAEWTQDSNWTPRISVQGIAAPGARIKTTNDESVGWYDPESGQVTADDRGSFRLETSRSVDFKAVVKAFTGDTGVTSNRVLPSPTIKGVRRDSEGRLVIWGVAEPGSEIKTTNDPDAGWYSIEGGKAYANPGGIFEVRTSRSIKGAAAIKSFGWRADVESRHVYAG